jgi:hypothetical protein
LKGFGLVEKSTPLRLEIEVERIDRELAPEARLCAAQ